MWVSLCPVLEIRGFVEKWHYSHSLRGVKISWCFKITCGPVMVGAAIFGDPAMFRQAKKYVSDPKHFTELRRLCCIDDTPKNVESFFIGQCLRWLQKNTTLKVVASYADLEHNHVGTIYKASNFKQVGMTPRVNLVVWNGKKYHYRTSREIIKGKFTRLAEKIQAALKVGDAHYEKTKGKVVYIYTLR
jgi:tRNA-dihydrouridine synthase